MTRNLLHIVTKIPNGSKTNCVHYIQGEQNCQETQSIRPIKQFWTILKIHVQTRDCSSNSALIEASQEVN